MVPDIYLPQTQKPAAVAGLKWLFLRVYLAVAVCRWLLYQNNLVLENGMTVELEILFWIGMGLLWLWCLLGIYEEINFQWRRWRWRRNQTGNPRPDWDPTDNY
jgi:hypothetical protein